MSDSMEWIGVRWFSLFLLALLLALLLGLLGDPPHEQDERCAARAAQSALDAGRKELER